MAIVALASNIVIAFSTKVIVSDIAYCMYFASLDWLILALTGFVTSYSGYFKLIKNLTLPTVLIFVADTIFMFANIFFHHQFEIYEFYDVSGALFLLTKPLPLYHIHLAIDYISVAMCLIYLIFKVVKSHSFYKIKYRVVIGSIALIIILNLIYMVFNLTVDFSVIFYALAVTLISFFTEKFIPVTLLRKSIDKAVNEMDSGLIIFDIDDNCMYVNEFIKKHFEIDEKACLITEEPVSVIAEGKSLKDVDPGQFSYIKHPHIKELKDRHYKFTFNRLLDNAEHYLGSYIIVDDVTEDYLIMQALEAAKEEADGANASKGNFLANMSHEIRTPLNSLLGMNEMILREAKEDNLREYAENIKIAGNGLLSLINDILDFSKIEAGKMSIVTTYYDIHKILTDCHNLLGQSALDKGLKLTFDCDEKIPSILLGDEMRIKQILSNLLSNAIKYTIAGSVTVKVWSEPVDDTHIILKISVTDTGIGISKENVGKLFDVFQRVDESRNRNIQGSGLGLAITREITTLMNGNIGVVSEPDKGSCFTASIPQEVINPAPRGPFSIERVRPEGIYKERFTAPKAKILIVDDVPMNLKVVQALLKKTLINVQTASGGDEAIERCLYEHFDLILMDHMMPAPDGIEAFNRIREKGVNIETPVIILTANALAGVDKLYLDMGFTDYLSKPVKGAALEEMLIKYLPKDKVNN